VWYEVGYDLLLIGTVYDPRLSSLLPLTVVQFWWVISLSPCLPRVSFKTRCRSPARWWSGGGQSVFNELNARPTRDGHFIPYSSATPTLNPVLCTFASRSGRRQRGTVAKVLICMRSTCEHLAFGKQHVATFPYIYPSVSCFAHSSSPCFFHPAEAGLPHPLMGGGGG